MLILLSERLDAAAESTPCERLLLSLIWLLLAVHCNWSETLPLLLRGEYFYSVGVKQLQVIFFSSCRNIQFGVFRAEIFILWCIVQKYWSGIVTCYMKMRQINELHADLASFLLNCARKKHFLGGFVQKCHFFWGLCRNITVPSYCTSGVLCRAFFRGCAEILIFGEIFNSYYYISPVDLRHVGLFATLRYWWSI